MSNHQLSPQEEYISKEQFCKECHIKKATALYLIQSGLVPAINTQRQTNRYLIARSDMVRYLQERERDPIRFRYTRPKKEETVKFYTPAYKANLQAILLQEWEAAPDVLRLEEVAMLLGYSPKTIRSWRKEYGLKSLTVSHTLYFPKCYLVDLMISLEFHEISPKTPEHLALIRRARHA